MKININALYSQRMQITNYISNDISALDINAKVSEVKLFFKELPFAHFPVVENGKFIGMLSQDDIIHFTNNESQLSELQYFFQHYKTDVPDSYIDLIRLFAQHDTDILPITDVNNVYLGYFELDKILKMFYDSPFLKQASTTLVIEKETSNYSMSEVAQIIESNNVTLLGMYISDIADNQTRITLRLDTEEVNEVIQSLRRYEYKVVSNNKDDLLIEQLKNRSEYLDKYLNI